MKIRFLHPAVFLLSAVGLAYELALMRVFSVAQWHHFAYMVISIAMLGFGAAGTVLALVRGRLAGREAVAFRLACLAAVIGIVGCYEISQRVPFETFELVSRPSQLANLLALYVVLALPFFFVSACIALAFALRPHRIGLVYAVNLFGSGFGAALVVLLMNVAPPADLPYLLAVPAGLAFLLAMLDERRLAGAAAAVLACLAALVWFGGRVPIRVSAYKGLSQALRYPDAAVVAETQSPLSRLTAVSSEFIRETPGQASNYPIEALGPLPRQIGLFFDAGAQSVVNECPPGATFGEPRRDGFAYLDYVTAALPYRLLQTPRVLVLGAGGGTDVLMALAHGAAHVTAIEVDPRVVPLVRGGLGDFSGGLYDRADVTVVTAEGRGFLQSSDLRYELIQLALLDSFTAAAAGVHALSESYLYTREAMELFLDRLSPHGALAVTRWVKSPPRDAIRMLATMVEALEAVGVRDPGAHLAFIRSWNTATIVASRSPLSEDDIGRVREFCGARGFDLCWVPGLAREEANRFTVLEEPVYYDAARDILSGRRASFYRRYLFDVRPATDDRPYFFQFFRWSAVGRLLRGMGVEWVPFVEWGYLALAATVLQALAAGLVCICLPFCFSHGTPLGRGVRGGVVLYFAALGFAYMFLEIAFIQKLMLFLCYPVYAVGVVLTAFLVCSGFGSVLAERHARRPGLTAAAVGGIFLACGLSLALAPRLFAVGAGWPDLLKILSSIMLLAPVAVCMGIPFPAGLQAVSDGHRRLIPWAWGINGACSVIGAGLATLMAIHFGFRLLVVVALLVYGLAVLAGRRLEP
ncbi:MAG: SAM-dependent methyltransferase [Kiritimatiellae bacterium]|nr:SAM-dependent methyltransferase [Kiritimatiellia bacterium]